MRRWLALGLLALAGCRLADLVQSPNGGSRLKFSVQPGATMTGISISPPVRVTVLDEMGRPDSTYHERIAVTLAANPGSAELDGDTTVEVVGGIAEFTNLRLDRPGAGYVLRAIAPEREPVASARFNVTSPPAASLRFMVQPSTTPTGEPITPAVQVVALDDDGETALGFESEVTIALAANPAGGELSGTLTVAAVDGVATFANLRVDRIGLGYRLHATSGDLTSPNSAAFGVSPALGSASRLAFVAQPTRTRAGDTIQPPVRVAARDNIGQTVTTYNGPISVVISDGPHNAVLSGTTTVSAVNGVATFADLSINRKGGGYRLGAQADGLHGTTSVSFSITEHDDDDVLSFTVQPAATRANWPISPPVQVTVLDAGGNPVTAFGGAITIGVIPNTLGGQLYGELTVNAVQGVATFPNLRVDLIGLDYRLTAAFEGESPTVQSQSFVVLP
jgi:hypothetical protein